MFVINYVYWYLQQGSSRTGRFANEDTKEDFSCLENRDIITFGNRELRKLKNITKVKGWELVRLHLDVIRKMNIVSYMQGEYVARRDNKVSGKENSDLKNGNLDASNSHRSNLKKANWTKMYNTDTNEVKYL